MGGLGVINLKFHNMARLGKWLWTLLTQEDNIWTKLIRFRFFRRRRLFQLSGNKIRGASPFWQDIWKLCEVFKIGIRRSCGVGSSVSFWNDIWICDISLASAFPLLYNFAVNKNCNVQSQYYLSGDNRIWDVKFSSALDECLQHLYFELLCLLYSVDWESRDGCFWRWDNSGVFSVNSFYNFLIDGGILCPFSDIVWQYLAPLKVRIHVWLMMHDGLLTGERLRRRHCIDYLACVFCSDHEESAFHLFVDCCFVNRFWGFFRHVFGFRDLPLSILHWWLDWRISSIRPADLFVWDSLMMAFVWILWKERNDRIFNVTSSSVSQLLSTIISFVLFWAGNLSYPQRKRVNADGLSVAFGSFVSERNLSGDVVSGSLETASLVGGTSASAIVGEDLHLPSPVPGPASSEVFEDGLRGFAAPLSTLRTYARRPRLRVPESADASVVVPSRRLDDLVAGS